LEASRKKAEDEKARVAEQERIRVQEAERSQKLKAELERKKAERETVVAQAYKSQTDRLQKEQAAAKAKVMRWLMQAKEIRLTDLGRRR
jgi:hypothetical protein